MNNQLILHYLINECKVSEFIANSMLKDITKYSDIEDEFCRWIKTRNFECDNPVIVEGYSAKNIHELAPFLIGIGVYNFLVSLRDDPDFCKKAIADGFPIE